MNVQQRISKLNDLLERVRRNAGAPRQLGSLGAVHAAEPEPARLEEPSPAPALVAAPRALATPPPEMASTSPAPELDFVEVDFDEEIVDITDLPAEELELLEAEASADAAETERDSAPFLEPPASSRRPIATTMDEALASAADQVAEPEREVPLKTPPPESGKQVAMPPSSQLQQPPPPVDLSEAGLGRGPSMEQLGGLVELDERSPLDLELVALPPVVPKRPSDAFEAELERSPEAPLVEPVRHAATPGPERPAEPVGEPVSQVVSVSAAAQAREEAAAERAEPAALPPSAAAEAAPAPVLVPEAIRRETTAGTAAVFVAPAASRRTETFLDLLDGSLGL